MRMIVTRSAGFFLLLVGLMCAPLMSGQRDVGGDRREKALERIEMMRMWRMTEDLDLTESEGALLFPLLKQLDEERKSLDLQHREVMAELRATARGDNPDPEVISRLLDRFRDVREKKNMLDEKEIEKVGKILNPERVARYVIFKQDFDREIRDVLFRARRRQPTGDVPVGREDRPGGPPPLPR